MGVLEVIGIGNEKFLNEDWIIIYLIFRVNSSASLSSEQFSTSLVNHITLIYAIDDPEAKNGLLFYYPSSKVKEDEDQDR